MQFRRILKKTEAGLVLFVLLAGGCSQHQLAPNDIRPFYNLNVSVRNRGFSLPFVLKNPLAAHLKSDRNPAVIHAIVEGFKLPPRTQQ